MILRSKIYYRLLLVVSNFLRNCYGLSIANIGTTFVCSFLSIPFVSTMAPDADKLRQRKTVSVEKKVTDAATHERISTEKGLKGTEVAIEGVIYDLTSFEHPGGESIGIFGGNDVTIQYKMIHPYHTSKHLEKMTRVGVIPDYHSE